MNGLAALHQTIDQCRMMFSDGHQNALQKIADFLTFLEQHPGSCSHDREKTSLCKKSISIEESFQISCLKLLLKYYTKLITKFKL